MSCQDGVGQRDAGARLGERLGMGLEGFLLLPQPQPYVSFLELWLSPLCSLGCGSDFLCRSAFSIVFPLSSYSNLYEPTHQQ